MNDRSNEARTWLDGMDVQLDALERALLATDAPAVQAASQAVQQWLQKGPPSGRLKTLDAEAVTRLQTQSRRFTSLRQAVMRLGAQTGRATRILLPEAGQSPTYAPAIRAGSSLPGRGYLSA